MAIANTQKKTQDQPETQSKRERMALAPWLKQLRGRTVIDMKAVSYLPANGQYKSVYGGIMDGFVDPVTNTVCKFTAKDGSLVDGGVPIKFYGADAEVLLERAGLKHGYVLNLEVDDTVEAAVYRKDDGEVAYLAVQGHFVKKGKSWELPKSEVPELEDF